jgi:hypothetical protein
MTTIYMHETTTATPAQILAALVDFGPGREKIFGNSADGYLKVHSQTEHHADVTEGSGGVWERLQYDWTDPHRIVMRTIDSNAWGGASGHTYTLVPKPDGTTEIDVVAVRDGKNFKGRFYALVFKTVGRGVLPKAFHKTVAAIEARNHLAPTS